MAQPFDYLEQLPRELKAELTGAAAVQAQFTTYSNATRPGPTTVPIGYTIYNSDTNTHQRSNGVAWITVGVSPGGVVIAVTGTAPIASSGGVSPDISITPATPVAPGSLSAADKAKIDSVAAGAAALTASPPVDVTKSAAVVGVSTTAARADHKHDVATAAPVDVGTANAEGASSSVARADHVHNVPFTPVQTALGAATGAVSVNNQKITNLGAPTLATDATTKGYVDALAAGLDVKGNVRALATTNITLSGAQTIDGVSVVAGNRVFVVGQTSPIENGIYVAAAGAWARAADMAAGSSAEGAFAFVSEGTVNGDTGWVCTTNTPADVVGTDPLTFVQFSTFPLATIAPADVTKAAAVVGTSGRAAREDHKHDITTAAAVDLTDSTNAEGAATTLTRSDHTHAHGARGGGTLHALATSSAAGFRAPFESLTRTLWVDGGTSLSVPNQNGSVEKPYALVQAAIDAAVAVAPTGSWRIHVGFGDYSAETLSIPENIRLVFEGPIRSNAILGPVNWTVTGNQTSSLTFRKLVVGLVTVIDGTAPAVTAGLNYDRCSVGGITTSGTSFVTCTLSGTTRASFAVITSASVSSTVTANIDIDQGLLLIMNTDCAATATLIRSGDTLASGTTFRQNIECTGTICDLDRCAFPGAGPRTVTFTGAAGTLTLDGASNFTFLAAAGTVVNGVKDGRSISSGGLAIEPVDSSLLPRFDSASLYLTFVIGSQTDSQYDGFGNGGLYVIARFGTAGNPPTNAPFVALSGYDDGVSRALFYGGGGWTAPDALEHLFFTAPTYTETTDTGVQRMHIGPAGQVSIGTATADATGHLHVATALGGVALRVSVGSPSRIGTGGLNVGTDANPTAGFLLDQQGAGGTRIARAAATTGAASNLLYTGAAHTGQTAATETPDVDINAAATLQHATGALATQRTMVLRARTYSFVAASTITDAASLAVTGAPVAGTNATITNSYALWVQGGKTRLQGALVEDSTISPTALGGGTTNDYAPTGLAGARIIRQDVSAASVLTGLVAQQAGQRVVIMNIATNVLFTLTLNQDDAGSTAANRFLLSGAGAMIIPAGGSVELWYDGTSARWRTVGAGVS